MITDDTLQDIYRTLKRARSFAPIFVGVEGLEARSEVIDSVNAILERLGRPYAVVEVEPLGPRTLAEAIDAKRAILAADGIIVVLGLDELDLAMPERWTDFLSELNLNRDRYVRSYPGPIVFIAEERTIRDIARRAPDFFDFRTGSFRIRPAHSHRSVLVTSPGDTPATGAYISRAAMGLPNEASLGLAELVRSGTPWIFLAGSQGAGCSREFARLAELVGRERAICNGRLLRDPDQALPDDLALQAAVAAALLGACSNRASCTKPLAALLPGILDATDVPAFFDMHLGTLRAQRSMALRALASAAAEACVDIERRTGQPVLVLLDDTIVRREARAGALQWSSVAPNGTALSTVVVTIPAWALVDTEVASVLSRTSVVTHPIVPSWLVGKDGSRARAFMEAALAAWLEARGLALQDILRQPNERELLYRAAYGSLSEAQAILIEALSHARPPLDVRTLLSALRTREGIRAARLGPAERRALAELWPDGVPLSGAENDPVLRDLVASDMLLLTSRENKPWLAPIRISGKRDTLVEPEKLVGREVDIERLLVSFDPHHAARSTCVWGQPGVGKTAVVQAAVTRNRLRSRFPGGVLWDEHPDDALDLVVDRLLGQLGLSEYAATMAEDARKRFLAEALRASDVLVVLDGAERPEEALHFGHRIGCPQQWVIVTSRERPDDEHRQRVLLYVDRLSTECTAQLLRSYLAQWDASLSDEQQQEVVRQARGNPRLLQAYAAKMARCGRSSDIPPSMGGIPDAAKRLLVACSYLADEPIEYETLLNAVGDGVSWEHVDVLVERGALRREADGRIRLLDLGRSEGKALQEASWINDAVVAFAQRYLKDLPESSDRSGLLHVHSVLENAWRILPDEFKCERLLKATSRMKEAGLHLAIARLLERALALPDIELGTHVKLRLRLAEILSDQGHDDQAIKEADRVLSKQSATTLTPHEKSYACCLRIYAMRRLSTHDAWRASLLDHRASLAYGGTSAFFHDIIGELLEETGRIDDAEIVIGANVCFWSRGSWGRNVTISELHLAEIAAIRGQFDAAILGYVKSGDESMGSRFDLSVAYNAYGEAGLTMLFIDRGREAERIASRIASLPAIDTSTAGCSSAEFFMARLSLHRGDLPAATEKLAELLKKNALNSRYYEGYAEALRAGHRYAEASDALSAGFALAHRRQDVEVLARLSIEQAMLFGDQGKPDEAAIALARSIATYRALSVPEPPRLARCRATIADRYGITTLPDVAPFRSTFDFLPKDIPSTIRHPVDGKMMILVPMGAYRLPQDTKTQRWLYPFYIDAAPMAAAEYLGFLYATGRPRPEGWPEGYPAGVMLEAPVVGVSFEEAVAYAKWAGKSLPVAEELYRAASGTNARAYPWGDVWPDNLPMGIFPAHAYQEEPAFAVLDGHAWTLKLDVNLASGPYLEVIVGLAVTLSLSVQERNRILDSMPKLRKTQIDELARIFREERRKFLELGPEHAAQIRQLRVSHAREWAEISARRNGGPLLPRAGSDSTSCTPEGIFDLGGQIWQWTETTGESPEKRITTGGAWSSFDAKEGARVGAKLEQDVTSACMDTGFRCVVPVFHRADVPIKDKK